jgi:hypothetical protein
MNRKNILKLIAHLEALDNSETSKLGFDMFWTLNTRDRSLHPCGSACCIGGHVASLMIKLGLEDAWRILDDLAPSSAIMSFLDISFKNALDIAFPPSIGSDPEDVRDVEHLDTGPGWRANPAQAVVLLRNFMDTGIVDWDLAMETP